MKKKIFLIIAFMILFKATSYSFIVIDVSRIAKFASNMGKLIGTCVEIKNTIGEIKDRVTDFYWTYRTVIQGLQPNELLGFMPTDWQSVYDKLINSEYYLRLGLNSNELSDLFQKTKDEISDNQNIKNSLLYQYNRNYRKVADKQFELNDEKIKDIGNKIKLLTDTEKMNIENLKRIDKIKRDFEKYSVGPIVHGVRAPANKARLIANICLSEYIELIQTFELEVLLRSKIEEKIKGEIRSMEIQKYYESLQSNEFIDYKKLLKIETK